MVGPAVIGWLNRKMFEETGDEQKSQGWTPFIVDTNGNGKRDDYVEPNAAGRSRQGQAHRRQSLCGGGQPVRRRGVGHGARLSGRHRARGAGHRSDPDGADRNLRAAAARLSARAAATSTQNGVYWVALASGHVGSFDRRKCKVLNGPTAPGKHCPEGWTLYQLPGPQMRDVSDRRQRRGELLRLGRLVQHLRPRQERADRDGQSQQLDLRAGGRQVHQLHRALSDGLLRQECRRPDRRSECRLEGTALWSTYGSRTKFHLEGGKEQQAPGGEAAIAPRSAGPLSCGEPQAEDTFGATWGRHRLFFSKTPFPAAGVTDAPLLLSSTRAGRSVASAWFPRPKELERQSLGTQEAFDNNGDNEDAPSSSRSRAYGAPAAKGVQ